MGRKTPLERHLKGALTDKSTYTASVRSMNFAGSKPLTRACSVHVMMHGEDFVERIFERVDVDHPAKDDRLEAAIRRVTSFLRGDGPLQSKLCPVRIPELPLLPHAQVGVKMPRGNAEGDACVELFFRRALEHGVHGCLQAVFVCSFSVDDGGWP